MIKNIVHRKTGAYLSKEEARALYSKLKCIGCTCVERRAVYGYTSHELAEKASLPALIEAHTGYVFAYTGADYVPFEGYKALVIAIQKLPPDFEAKFRDFVVIG